MPRVAVILIAAGAAVLTFGLVVAAGLVAVGSGSNSGLPDETVTLGEPVRQLELPLADDPASLLLAKRSGRVLVGIAVRAGRPIEVVAVEGEEPLSRGELSFAVNGEPVVATACGTACSRLNASAGSRSVTVRAPGRAFRFLLPAVQPPSATELFVEAQRTMNGLRTLRYTESLTSGVGRGIESVLGVQAPDRMEFRTDDGFRSVIIGTSRWDLRDGRWERSAYPGLRVPQYMWDGAGNARVLGRARLHGNPVQIVSAYDHDPVPAWFRLYIDSRGRILQADMLSPSHFMEQRFRDFNAAIEIRPPT
jgi:hypothetical protein